MIQKDTVDTLIFVGSMTSLMLLVLLGVKVIRGQLPGHLPPGPGQEGPVQRRRRAVPVARSARLGVYLHPGARPARRPRRGPSLRPSPTRGASGALVR